VSVARYTQLDSARLRRDGGLTRARRITLLAAVGASGFTAVIALIAATTVPGRTTSSASQPPSSDSSGANAGAVQPNLTGPGQLPQAAYGGAPIAVSGGS
jgi:hypothetical protein